TCDTEAPLQHARVKVVWPWRGALDWPPLHTASVPSVAGKLKSAFVGLALIWQVMLPSPGRSLTFHERAVEPPTRTRLGLTVSASVGFARHWPLTRLYP